MPLSSRYYVIVDGFRVEESVIRQAVIKEGYDMSQYPDDKYYNFVISRGCFGATVTTDPGHYVYIGYEYCAGSLSVPHVINTDFLAKNTDKLINVTKKFTLEQDGFELNMEDRKTFIIPEEFKTTL